ncbi:Uncharacterised protein [Mycolicibacterium phlei]|nr:Uncharacterised protein [Mycolicibacterium phlei]
MLRNELANHYVGRVIVPNQRRAVNLYPFGVPVGIEPQGLIYLKSH